jgi:hypothetical protein
VEELEQESMTCCLKGLNSWSITLQINLVEGHDRGLKFLLAILMATYYTDRLLGMTRFSKDLVALGSRFHGARFRSMVQ